MQLKPFQKAAVDATINAIKKGTKKMLISLPTGVGKSSIILGLIADLAKISQDKKNINIIFSRKHLCLQFAEELEKNYSKVLSENVNFVYNYHSIRDNSRVEDLSRSDYIIYTDTSLPFRSCCKQDAVFIGFTISKSVRKGLFKDAECVFDYSLEQSVCDGVVRAAFKPHLYGKAYEGFCKRLLSTLINGVDINANNFSDPGYDFLIESDEDKIIVECKSYRDKNIPFDKIEQSARRLYASDSLTYIKLLLIMGVVPEVDKAFIYEKYKITVWDIANFLYYAKNNDELLNDIWDLAFYPIADIIPIKSVGWSPEEKYIDVPNISGDNNFETRLKACKCGEANFREYEDLCAEIINYLFGGEFSKIKCQHKSIDNLFRMDMICALKGTSEFWLLLSQHYNSKFIVFEFKNYSSQLDQNIIYVTEKYLFDAALRNVAIIISRKGFSESAKIAADGCIKENGKLIIDLTDDDLIKMIKIKEDGEEPADYLLSLLEDRLMSIGK